MTESPSGPSSPSPSAAPTRQPKQIILGLLALVVMVGLACWAFDAWLMPPATPKFKDPSVWDVLIDSRLIVGLVRLIALVLAAYVVISVIALIGGRRWLIGFPGGVTTDKIDRENLRRQLADAEGKYEKLAAEYAGVVDLLGKAIETQGVDPTSGGGS